MSIISEDSCNLLSAFHLISTAGNGDLHAVCMYTYVHACETENANTQKARLRIRNNSFFAVASNFSDSTECEFLKIFIFNEF